MSQHSYRVSRSILADDPPFSALIMAAIAKADTFNSYRLKMAFPDLWQEMHIRYWSPGQLMPGEDGFLYTEWKDDDV